MSTNRVHRWRTEQPAAAGVYFNRYKVGQKWIERAIRVQRDISQGLEASDEGDQRLQANAEKMVGVLLSGNESGIEAPKPLCELGGQWMGPFEQESDCERLITAKRLRASRRAKADAPPWRDVLGYRERLGEKQLVFWTRFGVTQSAGSRYETSNRPMPASLEMLIAAYNMGLLTEDSMERMRQAVTGTPKPRRRKAALETTERSTIGAPG